MNATDERAHLVTTGVEPDWAVTLAEKLVTANTEVPETLTGNERLALAWALKDRAIAAWSAAPNEVSISADLIRSQAAISCDTESHTEISAIGDWVAGIADLTQGRMMDAVTHLDRATTAFQALGLPGHAAHAQTPKIMALSMLGKHDEALRSGAATLAQLIRMDELQSAGKVSLNLGNLHCHREEYAESIPYFEQAQRLFSQIGDVQRSVMSEIGIANADASLGRFDEALDLYASARSRAVEHQMPVLEAMVQEHLALVNLARGRYREALAGLEGSRQCYETLGMQQHLAIAEKQLGDAYLELRLLPEALSLFDRVVPHFDALSMPIEQGWALLQCGRALAALGRSPEEVAAPLRAAWDIFTSQHANTGRASVLMARAEFALSGADPESAAILAHEAADAFAVSELAPGAAQADVLRAQALLELGDAPGAEQLFSLTLSRAQELQLLSVNVRCQVGLGLIALQRDDLALAERTLDAATAAFEEQRRALPGDDIRNAFLVDYLRPYEALLRIALRTFDESPSSKGASHVLTRLEQFRARVLGERLGDPETRETIADADASERNLRTRLSWLYRRAHKLADESEDIQSLIRETRQTERNLLESARRRRLTVQVNPLATDGARLDVAGLQALLGDDDALVEYGVIDDELFACVVTRSDVMLRRHLAPWTEVTAAIRTARFQIETMRYGIGAVDRHLDLLTGRARIAMIRLHDLIWKPLSLLLAGRTNVLVVPHEQLGAIQFAALHDGAHHLAHSLSLTIVPSARIALHGLTHSPVACEQAVVLGESSRLPHAAEEARAVAALFANATILADADADAPSLRAFSPHADVLHLACHGEFRSDNPMFSALHLADGPFTVQDAESLQLRQGIVVLSACETGVAAYSRGDEMIGLVRAFMLAGAARVVASMWPVDDAVTVKFMTAFYASLRSGKQPSRALRDAQLQLMATYPHPFHWAAFTLYGGW